MDGHRANGPRRSRRTRSQRDKQREAAGRAGRPGLITTTGGGLQALGRPGGVVAGLVAGGLGRHRAPSSGSERENAENRPGSSRPRPPRRRRRDSVSSQDEDIIDGFAIASFTTLQALENDMQLKPLERAERLKERLVRRQHKGEGGNCRHGNSGGSDRERGRGRHKQPLKRKREANAPTRCVRPRAEDGGGGGGGGDGGGEVNGTGRSSSQERSRDSSQHSTSDRGYICDSDSDVEDKADYADLLPGCAQRGVAPRAALGLRGATAIQRGRGGVGVRIGGGGEGGTPPAEAARAHTTCTAFK
uniref:Autism susceptibility gene 2 protein homolog n=1 Tax=Petromyzon marinus TaxID=7757 RepID=A0AAJ7SRA1_PETMA|nr:autism susceptibility gene 2 protein homolog [Petromyzon marinus]